MNSRRTGCESLVVSTRQMELSIRVLTRKRSRGRAAGRPTKLLRYSATSVITTAVTLSLLAALLLAVTAGWANLVAVGVGSIVSFELNRRWVWRQANGQARWLQLAMFVSLSLVFLGVSSLAAHEVAAALGPHSGSIRRAVVV